MLAESHTQTNRHGSMSKDARGSMCADVQGSMFTDVSTEITGVSTASMIVKGSTCPYISTKGMGVHGGMYMEVSIVKMVPQEINNAHDQ